MCAVLDRAAAKKAAGVRLVQASYHNRSLCLYTKLGFVTREPLSLLQGPKPSAKFAGLRDMRRRLASLRTPSLGQIKI
jgi:hypothetical protein